MTHAERMKEIKDYPNASSWRHDITYLVSRVEELERVNATYRECWALTGIKTKLDIYAALCETQPDAQVIILDDVRAAWGDKDRLTAARDGNAHHAQGDEE